MNVIESVKKHVIIAAPKEHVFNVFTQGIDSWWPRAHHIGTSPMKQCIIEPRLGGRWYAISEDDTQCDTGKVLLWDPPNRIILAWQLTAAWQFDPDFVTEVEVNFTSEGPNSTRVDLEHRDLERFGDIAAKLRESVDSEGGWQLIMQNFAEAAAKL